MADLDQEPVQSSPNGRVADAIDGSWVDSLPPSLSRPFLRLSRLDRPIGSWLLLLPCWWGLLLAMASDPSAIRLADAWIFVGCAIGAIAMRGAGCTWNDLVDRDLDAQVARTRSRPLPSGAVSVRQAAVWLVLQAAIGFAILITFNQAAILLGFASLILVLAYPFAKRITWWPQVMLGLAFNWGALLAWAAHSGSLSAAPMLLYLGGLFWTLFYDTIYAHQDKEDDALVGIRSTARLFGAETKKWLILFATASAAFIGAAVWIALPLTDRTLAAMTGSAGVACLAVHLFWQTWALDTEDGECCLRLFRRNRDAGLLVAVAFGIAIVPGVF